MGAIAPDSVKRLVDHFDQNRKVFLSPDYKEEQLRAEFLNPFFESLGWDMDNFLDTIGIKNWVNVPFFPRALTGTQNRISVPVLPGSLRPV